jgi:hypothetical protein
MPTRQVLRLLGTPDEVHPWRGFSVGEAQSGVDNAKTLVYVVGEEKYIPNAYSIYVTLDRNDQVVGADLVQN